jgi:hypothetical protein
MLNLSSGGGNANYLRFSPQANAWTNSNNEEVQLKKVVFDFDNVTTGWLLLGTGVRDWQPDASIGRKGAQPTPDHKRGFEVTFYNKEIGTASWSSNGVGPNMGLESLYTACAAQREANAGKLPVVEYKGSRMEKIGKGTTRIPQFVITSWIDRPAGMGAPSEAEEYEAPAPAPAPAPAAAPAPARATARAVAPAAAEDEMF